MTTLASVVTKDAVIMGCDSLATISMPMLNPFDLLEFFDDQFSLKADSGGKPLLQSFTQLYTKTREIPYSHMTHVDKMLGLCPLRMGVMMAGIASIGERTVISLISEFRESFAEIIADQKNYTVQSVSRRLCTFLKSHYDQAFSSPYYRPALELLIAGYGRSGRKAEIFRIRAPEFKPKKELADFGIVFAGQDKEIQRLVFGTDWENRCRIEDRYGQLLAAYHSEVQAANPEMQLPDLEDFKLRHSIFGPITPGNQERWRLAEFQALFGDFSAQNAIDCVNFFIEVMINSQRFSSAMPTVGGQVHIALITREEGFRFVSREEFRHGQYSVPRGSRHGG